MSLPTPNLDDRSFQQLVDEAKVRVQKQCPTWTNHNVSDPGVTLIEAFAWMADQIIYRLNRVPERTYLKYLEMLGVTLYPPAAARADVSFRLSSHQDVTVPIPAGTRVSTRREAGPVVTFATVEELDIPPSVSSVVVTRTAGSAPVTRNEMLAQRRVFDLFSARPVPGDALYIGLDQPASSCLVLVQFVCELAGHGIDPARPPLEWEAFTRDGWRPCDVERDTTAGLNRPGGVEIHVPRWHTVSVIADREAAWLRCQVVADDERRAYRTSPRASSITAATVGGDTEGRNATAVRGERLGVSDGVPGQTFTLAQPPVLRDDGPLRLAVGTGQRGSGGRVLPLSPRAPARAPQAEPDVEWQDWVEVDTFAGSAPADRHFTLDRTTGEIRFGIRVRDAQGTFRQYGAIPPRDAVIEVPVYHTGGGAAANVAARALSVLRSSIPYVTAVYNRRPALGGVDGERIAEAALRGPLTVRSQDRAVTADDFELITRREAPEFARVTCVPTDGGARVLVVPGVPDPSGPIPLGSLRPPQDALDRVERVLDERRLVGSRVVVEPPTYVPLQINVELHVEAMTDVARVERECRAALFAYFNPLVGGPHGGGWPFGRPAQVGEVHRVCARVDGVDRVERVAMFRADPRNGAPLGDEVDRIELGPTDVVFSVAHEVRVTA